MCDRAAAVAGREYGVPFRVLAAIARVETGQTQDGVFQPWPWTVNFAGAGRRYATRAGAEAAMQSARSEGSENFDVGCFQINHRWHGEAFAGLGQMIDPLTNARYAARLLGEIFSRTPDWSRAAGQYHSATPDHARRYRARFDAILAELDTLDPMNVQPVVRHNTFPLLVRRDGSVRSHGSLVPAQPAAKSLIGG